MNRGKRSNEDADKEGEAYVSKIIRMETQITDMNDHCLRYVFNLLSLRDLLNTALSIRKSDRINNVLDDVFEKNFGQSEMYYFSTDCHWPGFVFEENIALLERFGSKISRMSLSFRLPKFGKLVDAVIKNKDTITEMQLDYCFGDDHYKVGRSWICKSHVTEDLSKARQFYLELAKFSKLERLSISRRGSDFSLAIEAWYRTAIPTMTHFKFNDPNVDWNAKTGQRFSYKMLKAFLALNPQSTSLSLQVDRIPNDFISFLNKSLPMLNTLELESKFFYGLNKKINEKAKMLPSLKKLKFKANNSKSVSEFRFLSKSLESLTIQEHNDFIAPRLVNLVSEFSVLKRLKLIVPSRLYYGGDDDVYDRTIAMDGLVNVTDVLKNLTKIVLKFEVSGEMNSYIDELSTFNGWKVDVNYTKGSITFAKQ